MIRLDHPRADYNLRFASFSLSKEQQVMEDQAIVRYQVCGRSLWPALHWD